MKIAHACVAALLVLVATEIIGRHSNNMIIYSVRSASNDVQQKYGAFSVGLDQKIDLNSKKRLGMPYAVDMHCKMRELATLVMLRNADAERINYDLGFDDAAAISPPREDGSAVLGRMASVECARVEQLPQSELGKKLAGLDHYISKLSLVCKELNRISLAPKLSNQALMPSTSSPRSPVVPSPSVNLSGTGPVSNMGAALPLKVFFAPETCSFLWSPDAVRSNEHKDILEFAAALQALNQRVLDLKFSIGKPGSYGEAIVPALTAFCVAYMFGVGCRVWRAWWLENPSGREEVRKLQEQIVQARRMELADLAKEKSISTLVDWTKLPKVVIDRERFANWLVEPMGLINGVAPKEALRYENLNGRLFSKVENGKVDLTDLVKTEEAAKIIV